MAYPTFEIEFTKHGDAFTGGEGGAADPESVIAQIGSSGVTDLFLFSHGWNNDLADARDLYQRFFDAVEACQNGPAGARVGGRRFAVLAVLWPSKKFTDEELIPGGNAAAVDDEADAVILQMQVNQDLERLKTEPERLGEQTPGAADKQAALSKAQALVPQLEESEEAQRAFVECLRKVVSPGAANVDDASNEFFAADPVALLNSLKDPVIVLPPAVQGGGAAGLPLDDEEDDRAVGGSAAGVIRDAWNGIVAGARRLVNFTTYYQMKERAGVVGKKGVADVVRRLRQRNPNLKVHLLGHSFGGRVVTAAADALGPAVKVNSMTLLQAAYSHNGLSSDFDGKGNNGFFRQVCAQQKVSGPILITYTKNDKAVGIAYPLASRLARTNASANAASLDGSAGDPYGGMGRNGAQHTPEAVRERPLVPPARFAEYAFAAGQVHNLESGEFIKGHSDIVGPEVACALLAAVAMT